MKKVLEGELLSIAHRVLKMKDADVNKLYIETKELYEKLQVLKFYQDNFSLGLIKDITEDELAEKLEHPAKSLVIYADDVQDNTSNLYIQQEEIIVSEERSQMPEELTEIDYPIVVDTETELNIVIENAAEALPSDEILEQTIIQEILVEEDTENIVDEPLEEEIISEENNLFEEEHQTETFQETTFSTEETVNEKIEEIKEEIEEELSIAETEINAINDHLDGFNYAELEFIRVEDVPVENSEVFTDFSFEKVEEQTSINKEPETPQVQNLLFNVDHVAVTEPKIVKSKSLNDIYRGSIQIGLNDRIAFEKHLFDNSSEDFNRVLSQLNTVSTFDEAMSFIDHLVKPEYNNWEGKEEYATRFLELIEKRFA